MNISINVIFLALFSSLEGHNARVGSLGNYFKND
jgi:hypothetical protein